VRTVVTGAAGFIGSHLSEALLDRGHAVIGIDNLLTGDVANIAHLRDRNFEFIRHDVTRHIDIDGPVDFVLHWASPASPIDYLELPIQTLKVGSLGTHNALGLAMKKQARFVIASTSEVYGDPLEHPQKETYWGNVNPIGPRGVYDEAKRFAEAMTLAYHRYHGVDTKIVRIFNTYGPRMRLRDGRAYSFAGYIERVTLTNDDTVRVDNEGRIQDESSQTERTVASTGIGAAIGAVIGAVAGGGKGAAIGAAVGAGAGAGSVFIQGRNDLELMRGAEFQIRARTDQ